MGLDSVELVMEIEKYFDIRIPDPDAEKIPTVQNMVDAVAGHPGISGTSINSVAITMPEKFLYQDFFCILTRNEINTQHFNRPGGGYSKQPGNGHSHCRPARAYGRRLVCFYHDLR